MSVIWRGLGLCLVSLGACDPLIVEVLTDCVRHEHCDANEVCFVAACVDPGNSSSQLFTDVVPANTSAFLPQVDSEARDLSGGLRQNILLETPVKISGTVTAGGEAREGFLEITPVRLTDAPGLPSAAVVTKTRVSAAGFEVELGVNQDYRFVFNPTSENRPPYTWEAPIAVGESNGTFSLLYPADNDLKTMTGVVQAQQGSPAIKSGVLIEGIGNPYSDNPLRSTSGETDLGGAYSLVFVPNATSFAIKFRPGTNPWVPTGEKTLAVTTYPTPTEPGVLEPLVLALVPGEHDITVLLRSVEDEPVARANVAFIGLQVGIGTFEATALSGIDGNAEVALLPGLYQAVVSPNTDDEFAQTAVLVCVANEADVNVACSDGSPPLPMPLVANNDQPVTLTLGKKIAISGSVLSHNDFPAVDARVILRRRFPLVTREFVATTDSQGNFAMQIDPGRATADIRYDLFVEPVQKSALPLPRHQEILTVGLTRTDPVDVSLQQAALVYGQALNSEDAPVRDVRIGFFSVNLGSLDDPLLVGLGQTNEDGEYVIPIPTVDSP